MSIFISYAKEDGADAESIYRFLKKMGLNPWMDKYSIIAGENWELAIETAIDNCRFFIAIISSTSTKKIGVVQKELKLAKDRLDHFPESEIFIIPVRVDDCHVGDRGLRKLHWIDMFPNWEDGLDRMYSTITRNHIKDQPENTINNINFLLAIAEVESKKVHDGGWTNLMISSFKGETELVEFWVNNGADIDAMKNDGDTALSLAICGNSLEAADSLLRNGADINLKTQYNWSYLKWAVFEASCEDCGIEMVQIILDHGAKINELDEAGDTALNEAASLGMLDIVKLLIERGAKVDVPNNEGETALLQTARYSYVDVVKYLLESGANYYHKNYKGNSALDIAKEEGEDYGEGMVEFLTKWQENLTIA